jgi:protein TonB
MPMAALTSSHDSRFRWDWLRIGSLSGTLSVHLLAMVLLAIPIALPALRPAPVEPIAIMVMSPTRPEPLPIPDEPVPQPVPRTPQPVRAAPVLPTPVESPMAVPELPRLPALPADPGTEAATSDPADDIGAGANQRLEYVSVVTPRYPVDAIRRGEQGTVLLRVLVGRDGLPKEVDVERSSGHRQLDRAAREAVLRYRFRPVRVNGVAVEASGVVPVEFKLQRG